MDLMIPNGQKNTLAGYMILFGADSHPPMLEKDMYDSWKSIIELYMQNKDHERMILELVEHGPLIWPTIEENRVTRTKKYVELSGTEKIQADCDLKATNIILQCLPSDIYSLVNHHRVSKDLWERIQLLMQGTSLTKQERKCKLYDAFDKFAHIKGGSLHKYYLRFTQLINDINIYKMKLEQFQVNTKFLNSLPPECGKFVTDVKLVKDLHTTNFVQLHAYLQQHELYANEVRIMRERNHDSLALVSNHQQTSSHFNTYQYLYYNPKFEQQFSLSPSPQYGLIHPIQHYSTTHPSTPLAISYPSTSYLNAYTSTVHQDDSGLAVPVFKQGDDPIDAINKMMSFMSTVVTSRFRSTNNQLRNSSNPRQQVTIHDGRVTVQPIQGRQTSFAAGMSGTRANILGTGGNNSGQQRVMKCFNCQRGGHMARQCPKLKRKRDATWFRDKNLLAEAQRNGKVINEEEFKFLADPGVAEAKAVLMANLSSYGSDFLSEVPHSENTHTDMLNQNFGKHFVSQQELSDEQAFRLQTLHPNTDQSASSPVKIEAPWELSKTYKQLYDSIKPSHVWAKEHAESLVNQLNQKSVEINDLNAQFQEKIFVITALKIDLSKFKEKDIVDNVAQASNATTIAPGMYKLDPEIVKQAKSQNPLDSASYSACKYVKLIQELLGYVRDPCPDIHKPSEKLVAVMPINKKKTVRFTEPVISSSTSQKQLGSSQTKTKQTTNNYLSTSTGVIREPIPLEVVTQESVVTKVYTRRPKVPKTNGSNTKPKIAKSVISNKKTRYISRIQNFSCFIFFFFCRSQVVQIVLWYLDSKCSKHMTGDRSQLTNFFHKFLGTVKFGNDQIAKIMGYGDYQIRNIIISRVYYMEGLCHNLFSIGELCDSDLEVAFKKHMCFVRNLECVDLLSRSRETSLYTFSIKDMMVSSPICLLSKASKTKSWLWHRRLSH
nr:integrase, catalytic region, zinc finger, CCHC-type, peptidase aspartic, catalytic [Tanacetum cinerariifolium]